MRSYITISSFLISLVVYGFTIDINPVYITGHLKPNPREKSGHIKYLSIVVRGDNKILAKTITDSHGNFELTFTPKTEKSFDFFCTGVGMDTILLASINTFESDTPNLTFYIPAKVKKNSLGKIICPKCNRSDMVYEISNGDPPIATIHISKSGDTTYSHIYKGKYRENVDIESAKYYCDRDKVKF